MKICDALNEFRDEKLWCSTHNLAADHLADNGDDWVCKAYAIFNGCQCCPENRHKSELSDRQSAFEFILDKLIQADDDAEKIVIEKVKRVLRIREEK